MNTNTEHPESPRTPLRSIQLGAVQCPCCSTPMPALELPTEVHQLMWGGFTCPTCHTRLDKWGEPVPDNTPAA